MFGEWTETDGQTDIIMKCEPCGKRRQGRTLKKTSGLLMGLEQGTSPKPCKLYDDENCGDDDDDSHNIQRLFP